MKLVKPHPSIYLILGDSPVDLGRAFVRVAEFYENPSKRFRGKFFTLEQFEKWYRRTQSASGKFSYYRDYYGYNVPGDVFREWATAYAGREMEAEQYMLTLLGPLPEKFYVIGAPARDAATLDHELAHAFWHLFPAYRRSMELMLESYDLTRVQRYLKSMCYAPHVYADESHAYIMFDDALLRRGGVATKPLRGLRGGMLGLFQTYKTREIRL